MGEGLNVVYVLLMSAQLRHFEVIFWAKLIILITEDVIVEIVIEQSDNEPPILIISDPTAVVALSS